VSNDTRLGVIVDYHGQRPCNDPMILGRVMDAICNGHRPTLAGRVKRALAELRKKLAK
jgi:hypothetical protein